MIKQEQIDPFYQNLPFILQQQQLNPDFIMFGTGLQSSAIAAYLSKMQQKKGLILDLQKTYGCCLKTVSLKQFNQLVTKKCTNILYNFYTPEKYIELNLKFMNESIQKKALRGYNIDIQPCYFFGNSITCECLKQADMDKYMQFRLVSHMLQFQNNKFIQVPLSKGKIFQSKILGLMQKKLLLTTLHTLMKIYHKFMNIEEDQNSTNQFDKGFGKVNDEIYKEFQNSLYESFVPFLEKLTKKNKKIMNYLAYIICNYQYNYSKDIPQHMKKQYQLKSFIEKFGKFINSCGIYGQGPYLYVDNGIGDVPQALSRISSVFGCYNILHPKVQIDQIKLIETGQIIVKSNLAPGKEIKTKKIYYGQTFTHLYTQHNKDHKLDLYSQKVLRVLILAKKLGNEQQCPSLGYFFDLQKFQNPVYLFMFDNSTHSCPNGYILYQFQTIVSALIKQQQINEMSTLLIEKLKIIRGIQFQQSIVYSTNYIRTRNFNKQKTQGSIQILNQRMQIALQDTHGLDLDPHFENFIKIIGKKDNYFKKKNPYQSEQNDFDDQDIRDGTNYILEKLQNINIFEKNNTTEIENNQQNQHQQNEKNINQTNDKDQKLNNEVNQNQKIQTQENEDSNKVQAYKQNQDLSKQNNQSTNSQQN